MVTILDIARKAKVAPSTVSLVANGKSRVSAETRRRVEATIRQLGYKHRTRRRRGGEGGRYGVVYAVSSLSPAGQMSNLTQAEVEGAAAVLSGKGAGMHIIGVWGSLATDPMLRTAMQTGQLDGLILLGVYPKEADNALFLASLNIPVVAINRRPRRGEFSAVYADYYGGTRAAVAHLAMRGHRRMALAGLSRKHWPTRQRYQGLRDELAQRGLPPAAAHLGEGYIFDGDRPATVQFCLEQVEAGVTALLIGDGSAPGVVEALEARGLRVPEDVSIIGCDGLGLTVGAAGLWLSSLDFDKPYVGELAARTILELHRARGRLASVTRMTAMRLVEGQTVGDAR